MADTKITDLTAILASGLAAGDFWVVVDVSDTTMAPSGTDKKILNSQVATLFDAAGAAAAAQAAAATDATTKANAAQAAAIAASQPVNANLTVISAYANAGQLALSSDFIISGRMFGR